MKIDPDTARRRLQVLVDHAASIDAKISALPWTTTSIDLERRMFQELEGLKDQYDMIVKNYGVDLGDYPLFTSLYDSRQDPGADDDDRVPPDQWVTWCNLVGYDMARTEHERIKKYEHAINEAARLHALSGAE